MAQSVNKVILVGNLGKDPEIKSMSSGDEVATFSIATSESWKDKSGEYQTKTQWHNIVVFNQNLIKVVKNYLQKGSKVYLEGALETRSWENKDGVKQYTTEVVIKKYNGEITMLDSKDGGKFQDKPAQSNDDLDQVPF
jgi:single-strand DNA-binding protein